MIELTPLVVYQFLLTAVWASVVVSTRSRTWRAIGAFFLVLDVLLLMTAW